MSTPGNRSFGQGHIRLSLSQWVGSDQRYRDFDGIVIGTRKELDCAQHRVMQARAQIGDFRDPHCTPLKIRRTLIEHPFQNKGHCDPARGH